VLVRAVILTAAMVVIAPAGASAQFTGVVVPPKKAGAEASAAVVAARADSVRETRLTDMRAWVDSAATSLGVSTAAAPVDSAAFPATPSEPATHTQTSNGSLESMSTGVRAPDTATLYPLLAMVGAVFISAGAFLVSTRPRRAEPEPAPAPGTSV
jgi:hypothetical protein